MAIVKKIDLIQQKKTWFLDLANQIRPKLSKKTLTANLLLTSVIELKTY